MTVRTKSAVALVFIAVLCFTGCGRRDQAGDVAETDELAFRRAQELKNQGNSPEALTFYLKVIEQRGAQPSPESHFEAGEIYLRYDPIEAIHHFKKYLELQPNSRQAPLVRQRVDTAMRELARTFPGRPLEDQSVRLESAQEIERLRRENDNLRAENRTLGGTGATGGPRGDRGIKFDVPRSAPSASGDAAPPPTAVILAPPGADESVMQPAPSPQPSTPPRAATPPTSPPNAKPARTYTVVPQDSPWSVVRKVYGEPTSAKVQALLKANNIGEKDLKPGMVLKIP